MTVLPDPASPVDKTPYNESRALLKKLDGKVLVTASNYPSGRVVPVTWVGPDLELRNAAYPGIYLSYAGNSKASDREVRGKTNLTYAPPGYDQNVTVPADFENKDSVATVNWADDGFSRLRSPYTVDEHPIPYNLDFNVTVVTRNYQQMFEIIAQLDDVDFFSARFASLEVPEDGTIRTLELLGGPDTSMIRDEDGKRLIQSVYSVRVAAELILSEIAEVQRVATVEITVDQFHPYL